MSKKNTAAATAESMARNQRDISVSEFFLKNRHLLGFDNPRKALLTAVKEAVDNSLDACEEADILPEISVEIRQLSANRFQVEIIDNGPGIVRNQIPRIFAKLLYGSKFHRLRMSRGQQGIGISAAGMYGQLTTGTATRILSKVKGKDAHHIEVQIDTRKNMPVILKDVVCEWAPTFSGIPDANGACGEPQTSAHGTSVMIEMEAAYVRGKQSADEFLGQCAIANPHLQLHYRVILLPPANADGKPAPETPETPWQIFPRASREMPRPPVEIKPHPHGVELGILMQMLKDSTARSVRSALHQDFSRVSTETAAAICRQAGINPDERPSRIAHRESEALFNAINETKLMRPPTDCLSPIGEELMLAGLRKEVQADFYIASSRPPAVYRGNPFQIEAALAYAKPGENEDIGAEEPIRVLRFANRVPLLYMGGACAVTKAVTGVNWKTYGLAQPKGAVPLGPMVLMVHIASVWVPFTSESKEAIAHYPEIIREITFAVQECGRQLSIYLSHKRRQLEQDRKRNYIELYIPHLALGLKDILEFSDKTEDGVKANLRKLLERTHLEV